MSARSSWAGSWSSERTVPPKRSASERARSACRLATKTVLTPWSARARAVSSLVSPVPMTTTWRWLRSPSTARARSTAMLGTLTRPAPNAVSERTRLPVRRAAANSLLVRGPVVPAARAPS